MEVEKEGESISSKNGRLCFKLKIKSEPITSTDHDQVMNNTKADDQESNQDQLLPFICPVCKNRFKSGKALGGHKRMHNLPPNKLKIKNNNNNINKKRKRSDEEDKEEEDIEPICPLCDKSFPSMKSLFGHMRSHPDRGWRGIQPPPAVAATNNNSSISTQDDVDVDVDVDADDDDDDDDDSSPVASPKRRLSSSSPKTPPRDLDLEKSLKKGNWSITARRGSGKGSSCSSSSAASSYVVMEESMREAVLDLMLFAHHTTELSSVLEPINDDQRKEQEKDEYEDLRRIEKNKVMKKRMKKMKLVHDLKQEEDEQEQGQVTMLTSNTTGVRAKPGGAEYVCSDCKRSFPSYQALGGHRSSHNKKKVNFDEGDDVGSLAQSANETATTDHNHKDDVGGGDGVSAEKSSSKKFLDFDLNELPPSEN